MSAIVKTDSDEIELEKIDSNVSIVSNLDSIEIQTEFSKMKLPDRLQKWILNLNEICPVQYMWVEDKKNVRLLSWKIDDPKNWPEWVVQCCRSLVRQLTEKTDKTKKMQIYTVHCSVNEWLSEKSTWMFGPLAFSPTRQS